MIKSNSNHEDGSLAFSLSNCGRNFIIDPIVVNH